MDGIIKLVQAASAITLLVAIAVGYGTVRSASADEWCEEAEYCHWGTPGNYGDVACATSHCDVIALSSGAVLKGSRTRE